MMRKSGVAEGPVLERLFLKTRESASTVGARKAGFGETPGVRRRRSPARGLHGLQAPRRGDGKETTPSGETGLVRGHLLVVA